MGQKPLVIAGIVVALVLAGSAIGPWLQLGRLRHEAAEKEETIRALRAQHETLQQQFADLQAERETLGQRVEGLRAQLTAATQELAVLRDVQVRYDALRSEKAQLEVEITRLSRERDEASERVRRVEQQNQELGQVAARLRNRLALADRDYQVLTERLAELQRQPMTSGAQAVATGGLQPPRIEAVWPLTQQPTSPSRSTSLTRSENAWSLQTPSRHEPRQAAPPQLPAQPQAVEAPEPQGRGESSTAQPEIRTPVITNVAPAMPNNAPPRPALPGLASQTIELPPIVVRRQPTAWGTLVRARVVEINPSHRFIVIDQGADQGVRAGMTFELSRGGGTIGQAVAVRVRPRLSACDVVGSDVAEAVRVGDLAVQRGP